MKRRFTFLVIVVLTTALVVACQGSERTAPATEPSPTQPPPTRPPPAKPGGGEDPSPTPLPTERLTATPVPPTATTAPTPQRSVKEIAAGLQGLEVEAFFEASYRELLLRKPETITALGASEAVGVRHDRLDDLSDAYQRETQALEVAILDLLREHDREALTRDQQTSYDVYEWYLEDRVRGHKFMYHDYPIHHFLDGYHDRLTRLLTELHPLTNTQDAEDYLARLAQVDDQVAQLLDGLARREALGVIPPMHILQYAQPDINRLTGGTSSHPFYTAFRDKVQALDSLSADEREALLEAARNEIAESVRPAFVELEALVGRWISVAGDNPSLSRLPDGAAYYAHILRGQCSMDISPQEAHELGLAEVARIQGELRQVFDDLGYSPETHIVDLGEQAARAGGFYDTTTQAGKDQVLAAYQALLDEMDTRLDSVLDLRQEAALVIVGDTTAGGGGYYVSAARDGSRPGAFHVGIGGPGVSKFDMPTVAYHEALPGHHFQMALAQELDLPAFRNDMFFNGYAEGWAMYAEQLAWELGLYDDDPYGNVGRLQLELLRAVRVVTDTGLHAMGWTREEALAYMRATVGSRYAPEVDRYIAWPAQSVGYKIGMLRILELRQAAMEELGDRFDLKAFHRVVVGSGSVPLDVLERLVQAYIQSELGD